MKKEVRAKKGFTLLELIVVIIIIGILAAIAFPRYLSGVERAKGAKARNAINLISKAEKMYMAEFDGSLFAVGSKTDLPGLNNFIEMDEIVNDQDWEYGVSDNGDGNFTVTSTRQGTGPQSGKIITWDTATGVWGGDFLQ